MTKFVVIMAAWGDEAIRVDEHTADTITAKLARIGQPEDGTIVLAEKPRDVWAGLMAAGHEISATDLCDMCDLAPRLTHEEAMDAFDLWTNEDL
jgi:hypothetical protein